MRIIDAVFERLRDAPAERIAIDRIARAAGVARSTVYAIFGSRAGLFDAVGRELAARSGYARLRRCQASAGRPRSPARRLPCVERDAGREPRHLSRAALDGPARRAGRRRRGRSGWTRSARPGWRGWQAGSPSRACSARASAPQDAEHVALGADELRELRLAVHRTRAQRRPNRVDAEPTGRTRPARGSRLSPSQPRRPCPQAREPAVLGTSAPQS